METATNYGSWPRQRPRRRGDRSNRVVARIRAGEELEALSARPVLPANQVASPGAAQEALPLAPAPAEVAPDQEERAALREEVKTLIVQQLQEEELRMEGVRLSVHFPEMREVYSSTAENIMSYDLEISKETNAESLREWRDKIDQAPNLLKPLIKDYLPKRKRRPDQTLLCLSCSHARRPEDLSCPGLDKYVEIFVGPGRGSQSIFSRIPYHAAHGDLSDKREGSPRLLKVRAGRLSLPQLGESHPRATTLFVRPFPRSVFSTAGEAVVEAKPIATPTIKYEIGPLLKDLMEWPSPPKSAYVIWELIAGNNPYGFDIR
ncbi:hypothetical protein ACOSQ2_003134 [Xanthoceras sorbifolium]